MKKRCNRLPHWAAIFSAVFIGGFMAENAPTTWRTEGSVMSQAGAVYGAARTPRSLDFVEAKREQFGLLI